MKDNKDIDIKELEDDEIAQEEDEVITLEASNGEKIDFIVIAHIAYKGDLYIILQPKILLEGMSEDEALVFKASMNENKEQRFEIVLDDEIINNVFKLYTELLENK